MHGRNHLYRPQHTTSTTETHTSDPGARADHPDACLMPRPGRSGHSLARLDRIRQMPCAISDFFCDGAMMCSINDEN